MIDVICKSWSDGQWSGYFYSQDSAPDNKNHGTDNTKCHNGCEWE